MMSKGVDMSPKKMSLPKLDNVNIVGGLRPNLMEVADPSPLIDLYQRLSRAELAKLVSVGIKYQNKIADLEIKHLEMHKQALTEMQKTIERIR
jgi:hypothetical protein